MADTERQGVIEINGETIEQVKKVVEERLGLEPKSVSNDDDLALFADALSIADVLICLEDRYGVKLDEIGFGMRPGVHIFELGVRSRPEGYTINRITELVEKRLAEQQSRANADYSGA